ncbi:MAG: glycoside hydrolase family 2 TIM barrel-domain containing protein [Eubacterium sp.]
MTEKQIKTVTPINDEWEFSFEDAAVDNANEITDWQKISLPHTWNNLDGQDGSDDYRRGRGWYKRCLNIDLEQDREYWLEFLGVNSVADVYVNNIHIGRHRGGYTLFRFNITDAVKNGENTLVVYADNSPFTDVIPLEADFTFFGGIYREVNLITAPRLHFALDDYGSDGIKLSYDNSPSIRDCVELSIKAKVSGAGRNYRAEFAVNIPDEFDYCNGIDDLDFSVSSVLSEKGLTIANKAYEGNDEEINCIIPIKSPHLWNGRRDPFRYKVTCTLYDGDTAVDEIVKYVGFRYFSIHRFKGFLLNGESYPLRGVNRHQDRKDMGWAITNKEHDEDFAMIYEMGANAIRLAHYPHHPHFYERCDQYGLLVWAEIPFVDHIGGLMLSPLPTDTKIDPSVTQRQLDNAKLQLTELILQQCHRPSIFCWSISNEVAQKYKRCADDMLRQLDALVHQLDSSRYSAMAINHKYACRWKSDIKGCNIYPGWYGGTEKHFRLQANMYYRANRYKGIAVSEYGAGSNIMHHTENPCQPKNTVCDFHSEEWQSIVHENALEYFMSPRAKKIWGTFVWNMFDFAVDIRNEGDMPGMNDKGLVTYDRRVKKDAFYLYKAYWSNSPTLHITSKRFGQREQKIISVKVYSNAESVSLSLNGKALYTLNNSQNKQPNVFIFNNIQLEKGKNEITATGSNCTFDKAVWEF